MLRRPPARMLAFLVVLLSLSSPSWAGEAPEGTYVIREGDALLVTVWKNQELTQPVVVRPDGIITLPLVNDIKVSGYTVEQVRKIITGKLSGFVNNPIVSVTVARASSYRVYTLGYVTVNGMFELLASMTPVQLLAQAGGPKPEADLQGAFIIRGDTRLEVDLSRQMTGRQTGQPLIPGDTLVVPARQADAQRVLVVGEVRTAQAIPFREGLSTLDAVLGAGGGTETADLQGVRIARRVPGGAGQDITVDLEKVIKKGATNENLPLMPGDIIIVPYRKADFNRVLVVGEVRNPRSITYKEGLTVLDAFVEAGGGTEFSDLGGAKVIRKMEGGRKEEIKANLDRLMGKGDLSLNINLLPGDIVVVPR